MSNAQTQAAAVGMRAESERATIGAILLDNHAIYDAGPLESRDFLEKGLGTILSAIRSVIRSGAKADLITVAEELRKHEQLEAVGGAHVVARLTSEVPTSANVRHYADIVRAESARRRLDAKCREILSKTAEPGQNPAALRAELSEYMRTLYAPESQRQHIGEYMQEKFDRDAKRNDGDLLGMPLKRFEYLARMLDGIREGLYIIAAETNVGKTAFLTNVFLDALEANPQAVGLYVSLDDSREVIVDRFTTILTRLAYHQGQMQLIDDYHRERQEGVTINRLRKNLDRLPRVKAAKEEAARQLMAMAEAGRLDVRDISEIGSHSALESIIREKASAGDPLVIAVDALFNLDIGEEAGSIREENIARANFLKRLSSSFRVPIMTTAEIRKRQPREDPRDAAHENRPTVDAIMETAKYSYNANVVIMLYPEEMEAFFNNDSPVLVLDVQKNKHSDFKKSLAVNFAKASGTMEPLDGIYHYQKPAKAESNGKKGEPAKRPLI